ncbi:MAG: tat pathway signal sequence [Actinocatenispora sp.]
MTLARRFPSAAPLLAGTALLACALLSACGSSSARASGPGRQDGSDRSGSESLTSASAAPKGHHTPECASDGGWSCEQQKRLAAAAKYMDQQAAENGYLSVVLTDRRTGRTWRHGPTDHPGWTASTVKLAMATDILMRARSGEVTMTDADHHDMDTMLNFSDNNAADRLWERFGGDEQLARFRQVFGMTDLNFIPGFTNGAYWGFVKCTSEDLSHLMNYVLSDTDPTDRDYLVTAMRGVAENQQWGVWAAGADQQPGNKDGWSHESDPYGKHWVLDSVGFAGPDERYTIGIMFQVAPDGTIDYGAHTVSDVVSLLFGKSVGSTTVVPEPDD